MNKLTIIGNITKNPDSKVTQSGVTLCTFTVAVSKRKTQDGQPDSDFFRVTAWRQLGENCAKYLAKGRKVCVIGPVSVSTYKGNDGTVRASMEVTAEDVEFLSPKGESGSTAPQNEKEAAYLKAEREAIQNEGKTVVVESDDLPWD